MFECAGRGCCRKDRWLRELSKTLACSKANTIELNIQYNIAVALHNQGTQRLMSLTSSLSTF